MKITRRQLRQLITEAYRTGIPYRSSIDQSDSTIARRYPQFTDKIAALMKKNSSSVIQTITIRDELLDEY